jgi:methylated-DNA-[protein]-cysteine S-methyltransferase
MLIQSITYHSPIGYIKITGNKDYITAVEFHDEEPVTELSDDEEENALLKVAHQEIKDYFENGLTVFTFPILQPGTHFQMGVWNELMEIPYGKTISYLQLAKNLGDPKKIRAAGSANGKNNIAIVVPCHRVIGSNNDLIGYAGGLWRKQWLLNHEGALPKTLFD